jgi:hypothetical protein
LYHRIDAGTFRELADALVRQQKVVVKIFSSSPSWGNSVAKRVQSIFIEDAKKNASSPMSASFDGIEETGEENWGLYKFSLADVHNKSLIHHAQLTRFKEEEL